jgi:hypothetical protein
MRMLIAGGWEATQLRGAANAKAKQLLKFCLCPFEWLST